MPILARAAQRGISGAWHGSIAIDPPRSLCERCPTPQNPSKTKTKQNPVNETLTLTYFRLFSCYADFKT